MSALMTLFLGLLPGAKTYIAALGLLGLAAYQASTGDYTDALQSFLGGLAAAGLRAAVATTAATTTQAVTVAVAKSVAPYSHT